MFAINLPLAKGPKCPQNEMIYDEFLLCVSATSQSEIESSPACDG